MGLVGVQPQFVSRVNVVEVYASVSTPDGAPVMGLTRDDFRVYEDGQLQTIETFAAGEFGLAVALGIDRSFSMAGERLALARSAAYTFLGELQAQDRSMLVAVGSDVEVLAPFSNDRRSQHRVVRDLRAWGTTSLHDAIVASVDLVQPAGGRRALVLLSDGNDRYSQTTADEVLRHVRRTDVMIYPIAIGPDSPRLFSRLAELTGGRAFHLRDPRRLGDTLRAIARDLRFQYLIGYTPSRPLSGGAGEWREIAVRIERSRVTVRARQGYWVK